MNCRLCVLLIFLSSSLLLATVAETAALTDPVSTATATDTNMHLTILDDSYSRNTLNAACLDGSPAAYYLRQATAPENATRYVVYFQGGGWCYNDANCASRSTTAMGSSTGYRPTNGDFGGILSPDPGLNPTFSTWNTIWVPYCDGTSFSGDREQPVVTKDNVTLHYRGRANMHAVVHDLLESQGMSDATHVVMDGGSAGGLTSLLHADFFGSLLPLSVQFGAIGDAGWFRPAIALDNRNYTGSMRTMYLASNATMNEACEADHADDPAQCSFAPTVFPYLQSKMFVLEGAYDSWQLRNILGFQCATYGQRLDKCTTAQNATMQSYGEAMRKSIRAGLASTPLHASGAGAFVSSCIIHVQSDNNEGNTAWNSISVDGRTPHDVVTEWFLGDTGGDSEREVVIEEVPFPGNPLCQKFTFVL